MSKLPNITTDFPAWYQEVLYSAELVDQPPVRGAMVIRPYGYAIWEQIKGRLDERIKATGHQNAAFPLLIPESFLKKEAKHVEGFAPEVAVVTRAGGKELEEPLVIRPTSETIVHCMFARWIASWRDLPLKINQWANVVRWEMRPRAFLRTTEFFWQEGHTAHETRDEAVKEVHGMLREYLDLAENYLAIPAVAGLKSPSETFPGAEKTYTFEALMQDGKALQMGTSHLLHQSFAESFGIKFQDRDGELAYPHLTSWGVTTRLVGSVVMVHGDQKGLVLPPRIAPIQVAIVPIFTKGCDKEQLLEAVRKVEASLVGQGIRVYVDDDEQKTPGNKFYHWELRGVPVRIEVGPRDLVNNQAVLATRVGEEKETVILAQLAERVPMLLDEIHSIMFTRARERRDAMWYAGAKLEEFGLKLDAEGGFWQTGWCGNQECEMLPKKYKATIRCLLPERKTSCCFGCDKESEHEVLIAKAY